SSIIGFIQLTSIVDAITHTIILKSLEPPNLTVFPYTTLFRSGFQTRRAALNFAAAAREFAGATGPASSLRHDDREIRAEPVPIAIDTAHYATTAADPEVRKLGADLRRDPGDPEAIVLGVDRLDSTKGIDLRLRALEQVH